MRSALVLALALAGCASDRGTADRGGADAAIGADAAACGGPLELGRCLLADGSECRGLLSDSAVFTELAGGDPITVLVGHQGSNMLALAARTRGILPGDPANLSSRANPIVELELVSAEGERLALLRGRIPFAPEPDGWQVAPELDLVVDGALDRLDAPVLARARVTDSAGAIRCGERALVPVLGAHVGVGP